MATLVLLHGWQSSKERWQRVKEEIKKGGIKVIVPDLPGFKKETELKRPWGLDDYVEWVKRSFFINEDQFFLLGHSFGGRIAIKFAIKYPEKLSGLILVSAAGIKPKRNPLVSIFVPIFKKLSFLPGYRFFRKIFYRFVLKKTDYVNLKGVMKETFKKVINEDLTPLLSKIKVPTLIIWGEKDKITPLSDAFLMKKEIKNSKLEILKDIGHAPHLKDPKSLSQKILDFIEQNTKSY